MVAYEDPAGDILCASCIDDIEVAKWKRQAYMETDPQPDEFCAVCGDPFIEEANMTVLEYLSTPQDSLHLYVHTPLGMRKVLQVLQWRLGYRVVYLAENTGTPIHMDVQGTTELLDNPL